MSAFELKNGTLHVENVSLADIAARFGTPAYVYSRQDIERAYTAYDNAFTKPHTIHYAVKANSNLAVLNILARLGAGFDIVSVGELERVLAAGGHAERTVFSGVGKQAYEIKRALEVGIGCFNVESEPELDLIIQVAQSMGKPAPISVRVNPDVDAKSHPYISTGLHENKFGVNFEQALPMYQKAHASEHCTVIGIDCHIGSQISTIAPYVESVEKILRFVDSLEQHGIQLTVFDIGGGIGIRYRDEATINLTEYAQTIESLLGERKLHIGLEPGRSIVGNAGVMLTKVLFKKSNPAKNFVVVDGAMNDLIRPALYQAWMNITPVTPKDEPLEKVDVVGPVCESSDFLGLDRELALDTNDLLAVHGAGAYGACMSSNYNTRPRLPESLVDNESVWLIKPREELHAQWADETLIP